MQEYLPLIQSPHFVVFMMIEILATAGIVLAARRREMSGSYLNTEERKTFAREFARQSNRHAMPGHFNDYADAWDRSQRTVFVWLGLSTLGFLVVFYKLIELYVL